MRKRKIIYCKYCGVLLNNSHKIYCNNICQMNYQYNEYINNWKKGNENGLKGKYGLSNHIRRYMLEQNNYKCSKCGFDGINPFSKKSVLEIHHIDGNYKNNNEYNLDVLCPNCHSMTNNYRSQNKNGRKERNKYN